MIRKLFILLLFSTALVSCTFTETMNLKEDGTGRMSISVDLGQIMAMSGEMAAENQMEAQDTIIKFKDLLEDRKDSIAALSKSNQERLQAMKDYQLHIKANPTENEMVVDIFTDFTQIQEANNLMKGFQQSSEFIPGNAAATGSNSKEEENKKDAIGVSYSYKKNVFKRDAFINDTEEHQKQLDSLQKAGTFMSGIAYKIKYTFPKKIKSTSVEDATYSLDGKTMELERNFLDYMRNPDVLDIEVELEK